MSNWKNILLIGSFGLFAISGPVLAKSDKLAKFMGLGGVCSNCDLAKKNLSGARMNGASFPRSNFTGTDLSDAELNGSNFNQAVFSRADLGNVTATGSNFSRADFSGATLNDMQAHAINLSHAILNGSKGRDAKFTDSNFSHAKMLGISFQEAEFDRCNLSHSDFTGANLAETTFSNSNMANTRLDSANFKNADFEHVDFRDAFFGTANMKNASFEESYFAGADLGNVKGLNAKQLADSCGDTKTKLPRNIKIPNCDDVSWAGTFTGRSHTGSYSFSFDFNDDLESIQLESIQQDIHSAMKDGHLALREARRALALALEEAQIERANQDWNSKSKKQWKMRRSHRSLSRTIRNLNELELESGKAQSEIKQAIESLERAQALLKQDTQQKDLAGGR